MKFSIHLFKVLLVLAFSVLQAEILYVDNNPADGFWEGAYSKLTQALNDAEAGDEIWVAAGIYYPSGQDHRDEYFILKNGVSIFGGFLGGEAAVSQRDYMLNECILSGDIGIVGDSTDNSYHVIYAINSLDETSILDGFTIEYGMADHSRGYNARYDYASYGGGVYLKGSSAIFRNCTFRHNHAKNYNYNSGGAVCVEESGEPLFENCYFYNNSATWGGALSANEATSPKIESCVFTYNTAVYGGAVETWRSTPEIKNSEFIHNTAEIYGGAVAVHARVSNIDNCLFESNMVSSSGGNGNGNGGNGNGNGNESGEGYGGAVMYMRDPFDHSVHAATTGYIRNSTFLNNSSLEGSAVGAVWPHQRAYLDSCVIWNNQYDNELNPFHIHSSAEIYINTAVVDAGPDSSFELNTQDVSSENITYISLPQDEDPFVEGFPVIDENGDYIADIGYDPANYIGVPPEPVLIVDIQPIFEGWLCNGDGTYRAYFGYETQSTLDGEPCSVILEAGSDENNLSSYTGEAVLVDTFKYSNAVPGSPGRTDYWPNTPMIVKNWDGVDFLWTLNGHSVTASLDPEMEKFPTVDITPIFDGWVNNGDGTYSIYFGYETWSMRGNDPYTAIISAGNGNNQLSGYSSSVLIDTFKYDNVVEGHPGRSNVWPYSPIVIRDWDGESSIVWTLLGETVVPSLDPALEKFPEMDIDLFFEGWSDNGNGTFTAYFGYNNHTSINGYEANAILPAGSDDNYFSDGLLNEHLPNVFIYPHCIEGEPGRTGGLLDPGVKVDNWNGADLEWHVLDKMVTADLDPAMDKSPCLDITPIYDGWVNNGNGTYTAYFGYETQSIFAGVPCESVIPAGDDENKLIGYCCDVLPDTFRYSNLTQEHPGRTALWPRSPIIISDWDGSDLVWMLNGQSVTAELDIEYQHQIISERIIVVDNNPNDGSWDTTMYEVFADLTDALDAANENCEIWVAAGTYFPDHDLGRDGCFELMDDVKIYGGFLGGETDRDQRDPSANLTVLSGNIGDEIAVTDNCYHVIRFDGVLDTSTVLDGFTITGGNADHPTNDNYNSYGGGILLRENASPLIANCIFTENSTGGSYEWNSGGAVALYGDCNPEFQNCIFENNSSMWGGAVSGNDGSYVTFSDCQFISNTAEFGGAYEGWRDNADFSHCEFRLNESTVYGGAAAFHGGSFNIGYCLFESNVSIGDGGAFAALKDPFGSGVSTINSVHNTYVGNVSGSYAVYAGSDNIVNIDSAMFWNNTNTTGDLNHLSELSEANISVETSAFEELYVIPETVSTANLMYYAVSALSDPFENDVYYIIDHRGTGIPEYGWLPEGLPNVTGAPKLKIRVFLEGAYYNTN